MLLVFWAFEGFGSSHTSSVLLFVNVYKLVTINDFSELELFTDCSLLQLTTGYLPMVKVVVTNAYNLRIDFLGFLDLKIFSGILSHSNI